MRESRLSGSVGAPGRQRPGATRPSKGTFYSVIYLGHPNEIYFEFEGQVTHGCHRRKGFQNLSRRMDRTVSVPALLNLVVLLFILKPGPQGQVRGQRLCRDIPVKNPGVRIQNPE
jgi:hypothetical protein